MCGIAGIYNIGQSFSIESSVVRHMTDALAHRGPDDTAVVVGDNYGFGMRRLSIVDLANGKQPFYSTDRSLVLVCNGEIYNYKTLRQELTGKGYRFATNCDVEVIVHLYEEYGVDFLDRLNGQF